ncbi:MFS transporter [Halomonas shantousis]
MASQWIIYMVAFAAFLGPFTQTIYAPILPELAQSLNTSHLLINLSISIFTFFMAMMQIVYGPLTDRVGRRRVLLAGVAIYILASLGCFWSGTIESLLVFRALQAVGIAAGSVVAVTVIGDLFEGRLRARAMGTFQMMVALGPVLGPVAGGFVGGALDYHYVFLVLAVIGAAVLLLNALLLKETRPSVSSGRFNVRDYVVVLAHPFGSAIVLLGFVQFYAFYNFLVFLPNILTAEYSLSVEQKGLVFLPLSLGVVLGSFASGRAQDRIDPKTLLLWASGLNVLSIVAFVLLADVSLALLIATIALFGFFLGLSMPAQTTLLTEAFRHNRATAVGVYNFARFMGMACGPLAGTLLYQRGGMSLLYGVAAFLFACAIFYTYRRIRQSEAEAAPRM